MSPEFLGRILDALWGRCAGIVVNGSGDYTSLDDHQAYSDVIADRWRRGGQIISIVTNGGFVGDVPRFGCSHVDVSLNATTPEAFDRYIGLPGGLWATVDRIRALVRSHGSIDVHSLEWEGNPTPAPALLRYFGDLPNCRLRVSQKVDNQGRFPVTAPRRPCDYLAGITVLPDGRLRRCIHDWGNTSILGTVWDLDAALAARDALLADQAAGVFAGCCDWCNYPLAVPPAIYYVK